MKPKRPWTYQAALRRNPYRVHIKLEEYVWDGEYPGIKQDWNVLRCHDFEIFSKYAFGSHVKEIKMDNQKKTIGQAYNKAETHIYTWYDDGTVIRQEVVRYGNGSEVIGRKEKLDRSVVWNDRDFWKLVPCNQGK